MGVESTECVCCAMMTTACSLMASHSLSSDWASSNSEEVASPSDLARGTNHHRTARAARPSREDSRQIQQRGERGSGERGSEIVNVNVAQDSDSIRIAWILPIKGETV